MAALPKNAKVGDKKTLKTPSGKSVTAVKTAGGWKYSKPFDPKSTPAPKYNKPAAKPPAAPAPKAQDPTRPIGGVSSQSGPKSYINMTRGEQDRANAAAQAAAIKKAGQDAENVRRSLIQDAYEDAGLTRSGNRKNQAPGVQPRDTEMANLRNNAKSAANEKFQKYLNEKTSHGKTTRRDLIGMSAGTATATATASSGGSKKVKSVGPSFKEFGELASKNRIKGKTVLGKSAKAFSGTNPALKGKMSSADSKAYAATSLSKDEFNRFKNVYRRTHKNDNVSDTYLKVMARYIKSKGTKGKGSFKTYKFEGS